MGNDLPWAKIAESRYDWAWAARHEYLHKAGVDLQDGGKGAPRPIVSLYGPSQVGKTGLLLRLLGLDGAPLIRASNVLRGEQPAGTPATVTAQVYSPNGDDRWTLRAEHIEEVSDATDDDFSRRLKELRQSVHAGQFTSTDKVHIGLPVGLFEGVEPHALPIVVDLPGDKSAESKEHGHVRRLMETFITQSAHVMVVVNAENLSTLGRLELAGYSDWQLYGNKFRIILTHAVSAQSVSQRLQVPAGESGIHSASDLRGFYREHLRTSAGIEAEIGIHFVEFGYSWSQLHEEVRQKTEPWIGEEIDALREVIHQSVSPLSGLSDFNFERKHAEVLHQKEIRELDSDQAEAEASLDELRADLRTLGDERQILQERMDGLTRRQSQLVRPRDWPIIDPPKLNFVRQDSVEAIKGAVANAVDALRHGVAQQLGAVIAHNHDGDDDVRAELVRLASQPSITDLIAEIHGNAIGHLAQYTVMDSYWLSSNFHKDCNHARHMVGEGFGRVRGRLWDEVGGMFERHKASAAASRSTLDRLLANLVRSTDRLTGDAEQIESELARIGRRREEAEREWRVQDEELRKSSEFAQLLDQAFLSRINGLTTRRNARRVSALARHEALLETALTVAVKNQINGL